MLDTRAFHFLSHYFSSDTLEAIKSDTLFNDSIEANLPQLPLASLAYEKQLQLQEDRSFDMETAINRSKQDRILYHSLSHYLYSKMLLSKTDPIQLAYLGFYYCIAIVCFVVCCDCSNALQNASNISFDDVENSIDFRTASSHSLLLHQSNINNHNRNCVGVP